MTETNRRFLWTVRTSLKTENTPSPPPPVWSDYGNYNFSKFPNINTNQTAIVKHSVTVSDRVIALWEDNFHSKALGEVWFLLFRSLAITAM